jgi:hypothetical protein
LHVFAGDNDQVVGELLAVVGLLAGIACRFAVTAGVVGKPRVAFRRQRDATALPGPARLPETMRE